MSVINTNINLNSARQPTKNSQKLATAMERLSTGKRINSASDDATGLAIATRLDAQTRGLQSAIKKRMTPFRQSKRLKEQCRKLPPFSRG